MVASDQRPASGPVAGRAEVLLLDNGSLEPASTLQLRRLAAELSARIGATVHPVSLAHSDRVPAAMLDARPAELFEPALDRLVVGGVREIVVSPLFIGPSYAITRHVPAVIDARRSRFPSTRIVQAPPLFVPGEARLGAILTAQIEQELNAAQLPTGECPRVVVVDHGSPSPAVTKARDVVAEQVAAGLEPFDLAVSPASMERREGAEFDFNEPTLETLLSKPAWNTAPLVVGLLFIGPGRHAGPGGDVAQIIARCRPGGLAAVRFTPLLGADPRLIDVLVDRTLAALEMSAGN